MARPAMRTFLFSDLRDYTAFIETRGDAAATKMLRASRRIVRDAVAEHRGAEVKTEGDSFYVVFRSPSPAVRCAIGIQRGAAAHNARHPDVPVRMGVGINTGEAMPHDKGYVGSAVIVASRLSTSAKPGQILVTDTVRSLVRTGGHASMRDLGAWTLKGIAQAVRVYEVEAAPASAQRALGPALLLPAMLASPARATPGLVVCPDLVQREGPLAALTHHVEAAAKGEARTVAVSGEGGIGKSRLVREVAETAHREGMYVFGGRSHASGPPYEPIVAALRPYAQSRGTEILRRLLGPLVSELRRLLPEIDIVGAHGETEVPTEERRERFLRTINLLLEDAAAQRPVLLVLEDFHDADEASRDLLRYLASSFHAGMCVVLTYRDEEVGPAHPLRALLAELDRDRRVARVGLAPLDLVGVERMTAALVPDRDSSALARAVFERSQGVPFYVEELLKTALDDPNARPDHLALPRTIADSVRLRVSRLVGYRGAGVEDLLEAAAVAEVPLGYDVLLRLSEREEAEASADLAAAIDAQLLERPPTHSELYQYRHALTREAIAAGIAPARRRRLHARVAIAIESHGDPTARAALLTHHFAAAGDRGKALGYARQGAANAIRVGAYATAIDLLRDAVAMASGTDDEVVVLEDLASALQAAGRASEAEAAIEQARTIARRAADARSVARLDVRLAGVLRMEGRRSEAVSAATRAVSALEGEPGSDLARALVALAELVWADQDAPRAEELASRALEIARAHAATPIIVAALTIRGAALMRLGRDEGRRAFREAIELGTSHELPSETIEADFELARAHLRRGEGEEARHAAEAALEVARQRGLEYAQARLLAFLTTLLVNQSRYREARAVAEQAVALARPDTIAAGNARISLANVAVTQGDAATALAILDRIETDVDRYDPDRRMLYFSYRAQALAALGRLDEAKASAEGAVRLGGSLEYVAAFLNAGDVAEARRDVVWARELQTEFERVFAGQDNAGIRAVRAELSAICALCEGRDGSADFERASAEYEALGAKARAAHRRASSVVAQLADPRSATAARRELAAIRSLLAEWGALRYVAPIDAALASATPTTPTPGVLSDRELATALLLAQGSTDARIAAELGVSVPVASRTVSNVLRKLGVRTRSQVASWVVGHALVSPTATR